MKWPIKTIGIFLLVGLLAQPSLAFFQQESQTTSQTGNTVNHDNNTNTNASSNTQKETVKNEEPLPFMKEDAKEEQVTGIGLLARTLGALLLILGLLVAGTWLLRRTSGLKLAANGESPVTVVSTTNIGEKQSLSVVKFGNKTLLVGATSQSIKVLATEKNEDFGMEEEVIENACSVKDLLDAAELAKQHKILKY